MSDREKLQAGILASITARQRWESRQISFYEMRHQGIRRKTKPFPTASDLHWPLIDSNIEKLKPLFFQQIVGMDTVATFVPMREQIAGATTTAEQWFDYKVRERTNLQDEGLSWIDYTLMSGRGVMKVFWDVKKKQVRYEAIDPMYFIVPVYTRDLQAADWCVHVMPMSKEAYIRAGIYDTKKSTLDKIVGSDENTSDSGQGISRQEKEIREGITHTPDENKIIVWEVYRWKPDGKIEILTYSPAAPEIDLRERKEMPYGQADWFPFVDFPYEIKDTGWYSPRGVAEILAPFEISLCNTWNHKHDAMAFFNRPTYRAEREIPNSANLRLNPGSILPYGIVPNQMPQPPISFEQEMVQTRQVAEQRISNPDFGMGQVINTTNRRTATEIEAISAQTAQSGDLRARIFRMALGKLYKMTWGLLLQYDKEDLRYRFLQDSMNVDPVALHEQYHIEPKGGINEVNRQFLMQKAVARKQLFQNSPWINMPEIDRSILELDDPSLIKRVFQDPNLRQQNEVEDEVKGIPALLIGGPLPVKPGQDYMARIGVLMQFLQNAQQTGQQLPPQGVQRIVERLNALTGALEQQDTNSGRKIRADVEKYLAESGYLPPVAQMPPQNVA